MNHTPDFDPGLLPSDHEFARMKGIVLDRLDRIEPAPDATRRRRLIERGPIVRRARGRQPASSALHEGAFNGPTARPPSRSRRKLVLATALVALALVGTTLAIPRGVSQSDAGQAVFAQIESRMGAADAVIVEKTLADLLPNRLFSVDGRTPAPLAAGIVVGRVTAVSEGRGYVIEGDDADSGTEVPFDTKEALWRTINVTVEIAQSWGEIPGESTVSFGVGIGGREENPHTAIDNYSKLGQIIVVLTAPGRFKYDPTLYRVAQSGSLIGTVSDDGTIAFPALAEREQGFLHGTPTLSELANAAAEDDETIAVSSDDNFARKSP